MPPLRPEDHPVNKCQATLAFASIVLMMPLTAHATDAHIQGRVDSSYTRYGPSGLVSRLGDTLEFNHAIPPNALVNFAVATASSDSVGASVVASVGSGWMRFHGTAYSAIHAVPVDFEAGGAGNFTI